MAPSLVISRRKLIQPYDPHLNIYKEIRLNKLVREYKGYVTYMRIIKFHIF